jgi:Transglycosylase-like domain/Putative peptidoglycan binding domain
VQVPSRRIPAPLVAVLLLALPAIAVASTGGAVAPSSYGVLLERGDHGSAVKRVQRRLHLHPVDGVFAARTERAVKRFQDRHGLPADGVVDNATWRALGLGRIGQSTSAGPAHLPRVLVRIARCESGGNPRAVSPHGLYRGKYQFSRSTWRSVGGHGDPARAPEWLQDRLALRLYKRRGTAPWPHCA